MKHLNLYGLLVRADIIRDSVVAFVCRSYTEYRFGSGDSAQRYVVLHR